MKRILLVSITIPALLATPLLSGATTFFSDNFSSGSTLTNPAPSSPTPTNTSYQLISSKTWSPSPSITNGDLKFGIASTSSGSIEVQALFTNNPVALSAMGDFIELTVTFTNNFTNTAGILTTNCLLGCGLYNSGQVQPVPGGINGTATTSTSDHATGGAQNWQGYVGQVSFTNASSRIMTRAAQTGPANNNQDAVESGSTSLSYANPPAATIGSAFASNSVVLTAGQTYTEDITIILNDVNSLAITNRLYSGPSASGTPLSQFGGVATNTTFFSSAFDAFAIGWRATATNGVGTLMDISSILITGQTTPVATPPNIVTQPQPVSVSAGGSCDFSVKATGFNLTYQWSRHGTNLLDGGNISGATSDTLVISPASAADVLSGANGYYVVVSGTGGFSTNSTTNSLSLRTAANLVWSGSAADWDLGISSDWYSSTNPTVSAVFNFGDSVTFDDFAIGGTTTVNLTNAYLSASSVTVNNTSGNDYIFQGSGSFAGPGSLLYKGSGQLRLNNANAYSGGTVISNSGAYLVLNNYNGLGIGPVTLALAGGQMEIVPTANANLGIVGDVIVQDDFTIKYDSASAPFAAVIFGDLSGTPGKTLTITYNNSTNTSAARFRIYGTNTVYNANLALADSRTPWAPYEPSGSQIYNGVISGSGSLIQRGSGTTYLNGQNTYSGGTTPTTGAIGFGADTVGTVTSGPIGTGPLLLAPENPNLTGSGNVLAAGGARTIANPIQYPSATNNLTLVIGGTNALNFSGPFTLNGNDSTGTMTNRIVQSTNTSLTTFSGVISDGGSDFGLTKGGSGVIALTAVNTYTGPTTVSGGTLLVNGQTDIGPVTVATNAALGGTGTILGPVTVQTGGALAPGASVGTLTLNSNLTINGNLSIEVNKSLNPSNDIAMVSGVLTNTGTGLVNVTNLGPALVVGDSFTLFNQPLLNGGAMHVAGAGLIWTNKLALDGSIAVVGASVPTPVINNLSVGTTNLVLSGTNGYAGGLYYVLSSTNITIPRANWVRSPADYFDSNGSFSVTNAFSTRTPQTFYMLHVP